MSETFAPVAPPVFGQTNAVAVPPTSIDTRASMPDEPLTVKPSGVDLQFSEAARSGDPSKMLQLAESLKGTDMEPAAKNAYNIMATNAQKFDALMGGVEKKGGLQTSEGRKEFADKWKPLQKEPQILRGIIEKLLGNPNARLFVTNGITKPVIRYDLQGKPLREYYDELGERHGVVDDLTGAEVNPKEYERRTGGMGVSNLKDALAVQAREKNLAFNIEAMQRENQQANAEGAAADELARRNSELQLAFRELDGSGIDKKTRDEILSYANRSVGLTQTVSQGRSLLDQFQKTKGEGMSEGQKKSLSSYLQMMGLQIGGGGSIVNERNERISKDQLDQRQDTFRKENDVSTKFEQAQKNAFESEAYKRLSEPQQQLLGRVFDLKREVEMKRSELDSKFGTLPFLMNPSAFTIGDQYARGEIQSLIGQFNAEAAKMYSSWRARELKRFPEGSPPNAGQLANAFTQQPEYMELRERYQNETLNVAKREAASKALSNQPVGEQTIGGVTVTPAVEAVPPAPRAVPPTKPSKDTFLEDLMKKHTKK